MNPKSFWTTFNFVVKQSNLILTRHFFDARTLAIRDFEAVPGPVQLVFFGNHYMYTPFGSWNWTNADAVNYSKYKRYGKIVHERLWGKDILSLYDPKDIQTVLKHEGPYPEPELFREFLKVSRDSLNELFKSSGFVTNNGKEWKTDRTTTQHYLLRPCALKQHLRNHNKIVNDFLELLKLQRNKNGEVADLHTYTYRLTMEFITFVVLNTRIGFLKRNINSDSDAHKIMNESKILSQAAFKATYGLPIWKYFESATFKRLRESQAALYRIAEKYLHQDLSNNEHYDTESSISNHNQVELSTAIETALTFLLAGSDSISNSLSFCIYHLSRNKRVQDKLRKEIFSVITDKESEITAEYFDQMPYLKACVKEVLRLNPPSFGIDRKLPRDIFIDDYHIPKGTLVCMHTMLTSRLPEYFPHPHDFIPERWIDHLYPVHPTSSLPFGFGPRMCIGKRFSEQMLYVSVVKILQNFLLEYHHEDIGMTFQLMAKPDKSLNVTLLDF